MRIEIIDPDAPKFVPLDVKGAAALLHGLVDADPTGGGKWTVQLGVTQEEGGDPRVIVSLKSEVAGVLPDVQLTAAVFVGMAIRVLNEPSPLRKFWRLGDGGRLEAVEP
jgi:hypothetical protein